VQVGHDPFREQAPDESRCLTNRSRSFPRIPLADRKNGRTLWDDVVNSTLLTALQHTGADIATTAALSRRWNHVRYVASVPKDPRIINADPRS
jgi:hypothetical protein